MAIYISVVGFLLGSVKHNEVLLYQFSVSSKTIFDYCTC